MKPHRLYALLAILAMSLTGAWGQNASAQIDHFVEPSYPLGLRAQGILEGRIELLLEIGENGELYDWLVLGASDHAFIRSIERVIDEWTFVPAQFEGAPCGSVRRLELNFRHGMTVLSVTSAEMVSMQMRRLQDPNEFTVRLARLADLDQIPQPVHIVRPRVNPAALREGAENAVEVTFYIDEAGRVRIPLVSDYEGDLRLALSVDEAVRQWRFEPPTVNGRPVTVRVRQPFLFAAEN